MIGSVLASIYGSQVGDFLQGKPVPSGTSRELQQSLGLALAAGKRVPGLAGTAIDGFMDGMHAGVLVAAGVALVGAVIAFVWLPARASYDDARGARSRGDAHGRTRRGADADVIETRRGPGRPRSTEADEAILVAAVELFAEVGLEGLTVEEVAARAGVGKATIYRRYQGKVDLVIAAVRHFTEGPVEAPDTGATRDDLRALVDGLVRLLTTTPLGRVLPILVAARTRVPELDLAYTQIVAGKRARSAVVIRRAIERGDLRADADPELVADFYVSPIFYRFLVTNAPLDDAFATAIVDTTMPRVRYLSSYLAMSDRMAARSSSLASAATRNPAARADFVALVQAATNAAWSG